jgi:hypothetical protein
MQERYQDQKNLKEERLIPPFGARHSGVVEIVGIRFGTHIIRQPNIDLNNFYLEDL